jgi:hypothetical protein
VTGPTPRGDRRQRWGALPVTTGRDGAPSAPATPTTCRHRYARTGFAGLVEVSRTTAAAEHRSVPGRRLPSYSRFRMHDVGYVVVTLSWTAACLVFRRRFAALGQLGWARACVAIVVAVLVLSGWPDLDSFSIRIVISTAVQFGLVAAVAARLRRGLLDATSMSGAQ